MELLKGVFLYFETIDCGDLGRTAALKARTPGMNLLVAERKGRAPHNAWASNNARQGALDQLSAVGNGFAGDSPINVVDSVG